MGAHTFSNTYYGDVTAKQAYAALVEEALHTEGHDPYNGTISTTGGFRVVRDNPVSHAEATRIDAERIMSLTKWGECEAVPLLEETPAKYSDTVSATVEVSVTGDVYNDTKRFQAYLRKTLSLKATDMIEGWSAVRAGEHRSIEVVERVKAEVPKEKAVTRYFIVKEGGGLPEWEHGHASQALARAALKSGILGGGNYRIPDENVEIIGITRRESGAPLVKATVSAKKITGTFLVRYRRCVEAAKVGTKQAGWYFYGWAAC